MKLICVAGFLLIFAELSFANSFQDDSHYVGLTALDYHISSASMMGHTLTLPIHCAMAMAPTFWRFVSIRPVD